jgi:hypothetical protein
VADKQPSVEQLRAEVAELRFKADELMQLASAPTEEAAKLEDMISRYEYNQNLWATDERKCSRDPVQPAKQLLDSAHPRS